MLTREIKECKKTRIKLRQENCEQQSIIEQKDVIIRDLEYKCEDRIEIGENDDSVMRVLLHESKKLKQQNQALNDKLAAERNSRTEIVKIQDDMAVKKLNQSVADRDLMIETLRIRISEHEVELRNQNSNIEELKKSVIELSENEQIVEKNSKVLNENAETEFDEILDYKLTQIDEYKKVIQRTKTHLTVGPQIENGSCPICLERLAFYPTDTWDTCGHVFCVICSKQWQTKNPGGATCPVCRNRKGMDNSEYPNLSK